MSVFDVHVKFKLDEVIDFIPDLPNATVTAYNRMGFDDGMKVAMQFSGEPAFWESEGEAGWMAFEGYTGACWVPTNYKTGYTGTPDNILMCYPMGDNGTALNNIAIAAGGGAAGEQAIVDYMLAELDSSFPNNAAGQASSTIMDYNVQNWGGDPLTRGVYSFETTTSWTNNYNARTVLRSSHSDGKIFFAGEGTNPGNGATAPGAMLEGERAADDVDSAGNPNTSLPPVMGPVGPDTTAPVITLNGDAAMTVAQDSTFTDPGATASDNVDGSVSVSVSGSVDTSTLGSYTLTYSASDAAGNSASATRTVTVEEDGGTGGEFVELNFNDFASSLGIWNDGGKDAKRYKNTKWANGAGAMNIQNNGADATMTTDNLSLAGKSEIQVDLSYLAKGIDANEYFQLQISTDGGSSFQSVKQWTRNVDFANKQRENDSVNISGIALSNQTQLRFRCYANNTKDDAFIDDVRISVK